MPLDTTPTGFMSCLGCGGAMVWNEALKCWVCYVCEKAGSFRKVEKSPDTLYYQLKLVECRLSGDKRNVRYFLDNAAYYRQRDALSTPRDHDDWVDRCGWGRS